MFLCFFSPPDEDISTYFFHASLFCVHADIFHLWSKTGIIKKLRENLVVWYDLVEGLVIGQTSQRHNWCWHIFLFFSVWQYIGLYCSLLGECVSVCVISKKSTSKTHKIWKTFNEVDTLMHKSNSKMLLALR